jgi:hypothetical protein
LLPQYNSLGRCGLVDLLDVFDLLEGDGDLLDVFDLLEGDGDLLDVFDLLEGDGPHSFSNSLYFGPFFFIFLFVSGFTRGCECHVAHLLAIYYMSKMCTVWMCASQSTYKEDNTDNKDMNKMQAPIQLQWKVKVFFQRRGGRSL